MKNWTVSPAIFAEFKDSFWGGILEEFWGRKIAQKNRVSHPVLFSG
jgi:hypothetical protein